MNEETWKFINTFAPWLSAVGTLTAVIATIYFSRKDKFLKLKVNAGLRLIVSPHYPPNTELVCIEVTNIGIRKAKLIGIGLQIGRLKLAHFEFIPHNKDLISSDLPTNLDEGDYANYFFNINTIVEAMKSYPSINVKNRKIKIRANTSTGKSFKKGIDKSLNTRILEELSKTAIKEK